MAARFRVVQRQHGVVQRRSGPSESSVQPSHLSGAALDHAALGTQTYLTVEDLVVYLRFPNGRAARAWVTRMGIPKCRRGGRTLLVLRRDVDRAVQPGQQLGQRRHD
jgi:hypothetical protein